MASLTHDVGSLVGMMLVITALEQRCPISSAARLAPSLLESLSAFLAAARQPRGKGRYDGQKNPRVVENLRELVVE